MTAQKFSKNSYEQRALIIKTIESLSWPSWEARRQLLDQLDHNEILIFELSGMLPGIGGFCDESFSRLYFKEQHCFISSFQGWLDKEHRNAQSTANQIFAATRCNLVQQVRVPFPYSDLAK